MGYRPGGECYLFSEPILGANMDGMPRAIPGQDGGQGNILSLSMAQ